MATDDPSGCTGVDPILDESIRVSYNYVRHRWPDYEIPRPEDLVEPGRAKAFDADAILHASGTSYPDTARCLATRQYCALIRKNPTSKGSLSDEERKQACFDKFVSSQVFNRITVKRLNYYLRRPSRMPAPIAELLGRAQLEVFRLLGPSPTMADWRAFKNAKVFSSGTVQGLQPYRDPKGVPTPHKDTTAYGKLAKDTTVTTTRDCLVELGRYLCNGVYGDYLLSGSQPGKVVSSSKGTTVPKDAVVDRFIAIEPLLNAMAQQGILAMLKRYLRRWGITLDDQSRNTELARIASTIGLAPNGWSTVDLSSASDTITYPLVKYLLPSGWFALLNAARTDSVTLEGEPVSGYASYCTMGNAFTFPLQCVLFAALTRASIQLSECDDRSYRVYGDDIIVPSSATLLLLEGLKFVGFKPNVHKTAIVGLFRESCGGDFVNGANVAPVIVDKPLTFLTTRHVLFNRLQRVHPEHPILDVLYNSCARPLIGPATDKHNVNEGHFEAPIHVVCNRHKAWYDSNYQAMKYRYNSLRPSSRKITRERDTERSYLTSLTGQFGRRHDLRGTVRYHVRQIVTRDRKSVV